MYKVLFFVALAFAIYFGWRYSALQQARLSRRARSADSEGGEVKKKEHPAQKMVPCEKCGVYLPESDAVKVEDKYYCPEHKPRFGSRN